MPSTPLERHVLGPSESLCELALGLAAEITRYERAGGRAIVEDVVMVSPAAPSFDATRSQTSRPRPGWRWELVLRDATHFEMIVGAPDGGWSVDGIDLLHGQVHHEHPGAVLLDVPQDLRNLPMPPPDKGMGANSTANMGAAAGFMAGGLIGGLAVRWALRRQTGTRSPSWHPDPTGVHARRYWNGVAWTRFVYAVHSPAPGTEIPPPPTA